MINTHKFYNETNLIEIDAEFYALKEEVSLTNSDDTTSTTYYDIYYKYENDGKPVYTLVKVPTYSKRIENYFV